MESDITKQQLQSLRTQVQTSQQQINSLQAEKRTIDNQINHFKNQNQSLTVEAQKKQQQLPLIEKQILDYQANIQKLDQQITQLDAHLNELNMLQSFMDDIDNILNEYSSIEGVRIDQSTMMVRKLLQNELLNSDLPKEVCKKKCLDDFKEILLKIKDINAVNSEGQTLLMLTLSNGFYEAVELLLNIPELDCNITDNKGLNALMYACRFPHIKYVKLIADKTDNLNYQCKELNNDSAIHMLINNCRNVLFVSELDEIPNFDITKDLNIKSLLIGDLTINKGSVNIAKLDGNLTVNDGFVTVGNFGLEMKGSVKLVNTNGAPNLIVTGDNTVFNSITFNDITDNSVKEKDFLLDDKKTLLLTKYLLDKGGDFNLQNNQGFTPFRLACFNKIKYLADNLKNIDELTSGEKIDLISYNSMNWITLGQDIQQAQKLLNAGLVDINYQDNLGKTLVHYACENNWQDMLKFLIAQSANPNIPNKEGYYPVHIAIHINNLDLVKILAQNKAEVNIKNINETGVHTPIYYAVLCSKQNIDIVKYLLEQKADPTIPSSYGYYPIHGAIHNGNLDVVKILIENNVDVNVKSIKDGVTPLYYAMGYGKQKISIPIIDYLLKQKADPTITFSGYYPIHAAILNGHCDAVEVLIKNNVNINVYGGEGVYPIHYAAQNGHLELVKMLLQKTDVNIKAQAEHQVTPLWLAAQNGHLETIKYLVEHKADVNTIRVDKGISAVNIAFTNSKNDVVEYLLVNKANPNIPNASGYYLIHGAIHNGNLDIVKILIENNTDVNIQSIGKESGITPLYYAMGYGGQEVNMAIVEYLLEQKANPNSKVFDGDTPMHMAGYHSRIDLIKKLLAYNGDLESVNSQNETPLYSCIKEKTIPIEPQVKLAFVKYLIAKGVNLNLETEPSLIELASKYLPIAVEYLQHPEIVTDIVQLEIELVGDI